MKTFISLLALASQTTALRGVKDEDLSRYTQNPFLCGSGESISVTKVNDDYCDCKDGSDEPGSSACSNGQFWCDNGGFLGSSMPSSRVDDGICDCCDGSDEPEGACADNCAEIHKEAIAKFSQRLAGMRAGLLVKQKYIDEAAETKKKMNEELVELADKIGKADVLLAAMKEVKDQAEEIERVEREKRKEEWDRLHKKEEPAATTGDETEKVDTNADKAEDKEEKEPEENFPYPKEYAAPAQDATEEEKKEGEEGEKEENFPYPQEYAFKEGDEEAAGEEGVEEKEAAKEEEETQEEEEEEDEEEEESEKYVEYESEEASKLRSEYSTAESNLQAFKTQQKGLTDKLAMNFGEQGEHMHLVDKCFTIPQKQYTYEFCAFKNGSQQEGGRATDLGKFESFNNGLMKFTHGQKCWNGPERSLNVQFVCGQEPKVLTVDETSTCVYAMEFSTPSMCTEADEAKLAKLVGNKPASKQEL